MLGGFMRLHWGIDSRQQLVTVRGEGEVTLADMEEYRLVCSRVADKCAEAEAIGLT